MPAPRRLLPSMSLLSAFDAVIRTGSTLAASQDLNLTQGAVSRLIQKLEAQLGVTLFLRERRRLIPTDKALAYAKDVAKALELVSRSSLRVQSDTGDGTLSLAILPTFGVRWLAPRLPEFLAAHPGITLNLGTRLNPFDFDDEGFDAAIHFGTDDWPGTQSTKLFDERLIATCSPNFLHHNPIRSAADLAQLPLLRLESRPGAWQTWLAYYGVEGAPRGGPVFDQFAQIIQATIHGLGIALLPEFLARPELSDGRLVAAWGAPVMTEGAYHLVWPRTGASHAPLRHFQSWLDAEIGKSLPEGL